MATITNQVEMRVAGMSRSGNHAILNWIVRQAAGRHCLLNCAEPRTNPFETARPLTSGRSYRVNYRGFRLQRERQGDFSQKDWLIHSYEDCFLTTLASGLFEEEHDRWVGCSARRIDVLILRDPFNLFASRLKSGYSGVPLKSTVRIWKQHAKQFLGRRRILKGPTVLISYNDWHADRGYRRQLADQLGLEFTDAGKEEVVDCAGGSSFDGRRCHGRASRMSVNSRWKQFADDERFRAMLDGEIQELSKQIFGPLPMAGFSCLSHAGGCD